MKSKYVEQKLKKDIEETTPDVLDRALDRCSRENQNQSKSPLRPARWKVCTALAAALALVIGLGFFITGINSVDSVIGLDVNPSIEIEINNREKVLSVEALNQDAEKILDDMDLAGTELKVAVNAIIGSMYTNGYINADQNSVLVSVKSRNAGRGEALRKELSGYVQSALESKQVEGAVISNVLDIDTIYTWAERCGISEGKAALIEAILNADPTHSLEELAELNITELNLLAEAKKVQDLNVSGSAGTGKYIGADKVKELIMERLPECRIAEIEMDWEDGRMIYEGEAFLNNTEYEFEIDAVTGEFLKWDVESGAIVPDNYISKQEAESIILGKLPKGAVIAELKLEEEDGRMVYEAEAYGQGEEYDIEIDAVTGEVLKLESEKDDDYNEGRPSGNNYMSDTEIRGIILEKFSGGNIVELELDYEDGKYEGEVIAGNIKYEFAISAVSGKFLELEKEWDASGAEISAERAKGIIMGRLPGCTVIELELDEDKGILKYEGEAILNDKEYEFEIDAVSGVILELEIED